MSLAAVALVQFRWRPRVEQNLEYVLEQVRRIGLRRSTDMVCLPEFFLGPPWYFPGYAHLKGTVDDTIPGRVTDRLGRLARQYRMYLLCGTILERKDGEYFNASVALNDRGEIVAVARKLHCYAAELAYIKPGDKPVIIDTPLGRIGLCVCSDFWIVETPRMMALDGAEIIYVSGASLVQNLATTRACLVANSVFNVCYTLYTSVVGTVAGQRAGRKLEIAFCGHTTIAGPNGIIDTLDDQEANLHGRIDLSVVRSARAVDPKFKNTLYWCLWGRRPELYSDLGKPYREARTDLRELLRGVF